MGLLDEAMASRSLRAGIALTCLLVSGVLLFGLQPAYSAAEFTIHPGKGIGPVTLGMDVDELRRVFGGSLSTGADQTVYMVPQQGLAVSVLYGRVTRVRTTNPSHRSEAGFGPGDQDWTRVRQAECNGGLNEASAVYEAAKGFEIHCPLKGIIIEVQEGKVTGLSVVPAEALRSGARP